MPVKTTIIHELAHDLEGNLPQKKPPTQPHTPYMNALSTTG
jgi:hypothetical protein